MINYNKTAKKTKIFLGIMKKFRLNDNNFLSKNEPLSMYSLTFNSFMQRYFIQLSYNGTAYHGWQIQENTYRTVQQVLNQMLSRLLNEPISITGCGRTDTGVHATEYFAHFDSTIEDLEINQDKWIFKFNFALPADIAIQKIITVKEKYLMMITISDYHPKGL